ncbi:hypothetical protein IW262DRAFT_1298188 [Armillaria fumosa]|nr:hypothetical protein IW262DRAFT_1298188 [Armillaria fumosa]
MRQIMTSHASPELSEEPHHKYEWSCMFKKVRSALKINNLTDLNYDHGVQTLRACLNQLNIATEHSPCLCESVKYELANDSLGEARSAGVDAVTRKALHSKCRFSSTMGAFGFYLRTLMPTDKGKIFECTRRDVASAPEVGMLASLTEWTNSLLIDTYGTSNCGFSRDYASSGKVAHAMVEMTLVLKSGKGMGSAISTIMHCLDVHSCDDMKRCSIHRLFLFLLTRRKEICEVITLRNDKRETKKTVASEMQRVTRTDTSGKGVRTLLAQLILQSTHRVFVEEGFNLEDTETTVRGVIELDSMVKTVCDAVCGREELIHGTTMKSRMADKLKVATRRHRERGGIGNEQRARHRRAQADTTRGAFHAEMGWMRTWKSGVHGGEGRTMRADGTVYERTSAEGRRPEWCARMEGHGGVDDPVAVREVDEDCMRRDVNRGSLLLASKEGWTVVWLQELVGTGRFLHQGGSTGVWREFIEMAVFTEGASDGGSDVDEGKVISTRKAEGTGADKHAPMYGNW